MRSLFLVVVVLCAGCSTSGLTTPTAPAPSLPAATTPASIRLTAASRPDRSVDLAATVLTASGGFVSNVVVSFSVSSGSVAPADVETDAAGIARSILTPDAAKTIAHVQVGSLNASVDVLSAAPLPPPPPPPPPPPSPDPQVPPLTVTLLVTPSPVGTATIFTLATQAIAGAAWAFGDGATATTAASTTAHVYTNSGSYLASVAVTDARGRTASTAATVTIADPPPPAPPPAASVIAVTVNCGTPAAHGSLTPCNVAATIDGLPATTLLTQVVWLWGDGTMNSNPLPGSINPVAVLQQHAYAQAGVYTIDVAATFNTGATGKASKTLTIP